MRTPTADGSPGRRTSRIIFAGLWIIMLVTSLFLVSMFLTTFLTRSLGTSYVSLDWSGYVVASDLTNPQPEVIGISGSWTVPTVNASQTDSFSAAWIGIGGLCCPTDQTLIQIGTEQDSIRGIGVYSAWYELLPNDSVTITAMQVSPGDKVAASINLVDAAKNEWSMEIVDITKEQEPKFQETFIYNSSRLSAEWIMERPTVNNGLSNLANFGKISFTNANVVIGASDGAITKFRFAKIIMQDRRNNALVTVSSLTSGGSSFTVNYLA